MMDDLKTTLSNAKMFISVLTSPDDSGATEMIRQLDHQISEVTSENSPVIWSPIDTAPRDGTWFWAASSTGKPYYVHFNDRYDRYPIDLKGHVWNTEPTRWTMKI